MPNEKSVLFVDDEEEILEILVDLFRDNDYNIFTATAAKQALDIIYDKPIDFVISDLKLPDRTGVELLEEVKSKRPDAVRVLTSGFLDVQFGEVVESGCDGTLYISKPWDLSLIKALVCRRLDN